MCNVEEIGVMLSLLNLEARSVISLRLDEHSFPLDPREAVSTYSVGSSDHAHDQKERGHNKRTINVEEAILAETRTTVGLKIIGNKLIKTVGKYQSCVVYN